MKWGGGGGKHITIHMAEKKEDSSNVNSSTSFMQWLLVIIFSQQVNVLPIVLWDFFPTVALTI